MESDTNDNYEDLYDEEDAPKHAKLVHKVLSLNKIQHLKKPSRSEPTHQVSEFNLVKSITGEKGSVQINELTKPLKSRKSHIKLSENVKRVQKSSHTLPKPLEKPQANRIRRTVAYEKTRLQLDKWEPTVTANRVSTDLTFPLNNDVKLDKKESENFVKMWRVKSKLEEELEKHEPNVEEYHIHLEQQEKFPLTMKEMLSRRKEAAKLRAYQGYKEAKARRQGKIKSKKYHRIQKRERIKKKLKEFEELQKTNPEEALKKLEEIEKSRVEERFSLRHKSTGKWARNQQIRAKYDKESRQVLAQQLTISRDLTQKQKADESESEEEETGISGKSTTVIDPDNPWVNGIKPGKEVTDFLGGYRKYWMEKNKESDEIIEQAEEVPETGGTINDQIKNGSSFETKEVMQEPDTEEHVNDQMEKEDPDLNKQTIKKKKKSKKVSSDMNVSKSTSEWDVSVVDNTEVIEDMFDRAENKIKRKMMNNVKKLKKKLTEKTTPKRIRDKPEHKKPDLSLPVQKKVPQVDEEIIQNPTKELEHVESSEALTNLKNILASSTKEKASDIDPNKYLKVKATSLSTAIPDILTEANEGEETTQREIISEAFEDDDILDEFNKEKQNEIDNHKPKNVDLTLPGWGSWGGTNIKVNKRKRRRFTVKAPPKVPRRDDNKGSLIINEKAQKAIKDHLVSEVPFPFKTVKDFEASIRAPISNTFVPETAYRKLIKPVVTTKMGTIIEPISKDILLNKSG